MRSLSVKALAAGALLAVAGCTEVECPLDSIVAMTCGLYSAETGAPHKLSVTLDVLAAGTDSVLLNQATGISSFLLPVRRGVATDTIVLVFTNDVPQEAADSIFLDHTDEPHFEALDCPGTVFHTLRGVRWTSHDLSRMPLTVDSVSIVRTSVNYEDLENLRIFLRAAAE